MTAQYAAATQWRLSVIANNGDTNAEIQDVQLFDDYFSLQNHAIDGTANASAGTADNAFDDDLTTNWSASISSTPTLEYTFNLPKSIKQYAITASGTTAPESWELQYWDGSTWVVMHAVSTQVDWVSDEQRIFSF